MCGSMLLSTKWLNRNKHCLERAHMAALKWFKQNMTLRLYRIHSRKLRANFLVNTPTAELQSIRHTTMNFIFITALSLCSFWGISISASDFQTTKVQPGEDVTLQCTNNSKMDSLTLWFRLVNSTTVSCISLSLASKREVKYSDEFQNGKFEMTTNISTLFLKIKRVDQSDSGLYFCGFYSDGRLLFSVTRLNVGDTDEPADDMGSKCKQESDVVAKLTSVTLGVLSVFLLMVIIGLVVQNRKLQQAFKEQQNQDQSESRDNDDLNYATVTFQPKAKRNQMESNVIYAATR
ncbi:unnamed protein product [Oreochromis niloticus]|nr:unnamed protein product [Mustela putorius furo]